MIIKLSRKKKLQKEGKIKERRKGQYENNGNLKKSNYSNKMRDSVIKIKNTMNQGTEY